MATYATVADYEVLWPLSGESEEARVSAMLGRTSMFIDALVERKGIDAEERRDALKMLCVDFTHRYSENDRAGLLSARTYQAGSFMQTESIRRLQDDFDAFARDYYGILGISTPQVCFAWPGSES